MSFSSCLCRQCQATRTINDGIFPLAEHTLYTKKELYPHLRRHTNRTLCLALVFHEHDWIRILCVKVHLLPRRNLAKLHMELRDLIPPLTPGFFCFLKPRTNLCAQTNRDLAQDLARLVGIVSAGAVGNPQPRANKLVHAVQHSLALCVLPLCECMHHVFHLVWQESRKGTQAVRVHTQEVFAFHKSAVGCRHFPRERFPLWHPLERRSEEGNHTEH
mmetsp:Transcript_36813/g.57120  ORF Transcript_36813/g.57120 Transcript_36813/m.57120 type:complete len:217 (-) Transcript_36813:3325-3975(-)